MAGWTYCHRDDVTPRLHFPVTTMYERDDFGVAFQAQYASRSNRPPKP